MKSIEQEAKKIMDEFIEALGVVDETDLNVGIQRVHTTRDGGDDVKDPSFAGLFLKNTPKGVQNGYVVSEKKKWV